MMYSKMESDVDAIFGIKPVQARSLTYAVFQDSQAALRRATKTPQMVVCHKDKYDETYAAIKELRWLVLGTVVKASEFLPDSETVYLLWDQEPKL